MHRLAHRDLQIERRRSAILLRRRAHQAGQSLAGLAHRRTHALGMDGRPIGRQSRRLTPTPTARTQKQAIKLVGTAGLTAAAKTSADEAWLVLRRLERSQSLPEVGLSD